MARVDSRKAPPVESASRTTYPVDSRKTELIENLKYFLLVLPFRKSTLRIVENQASFKEECRQDADRTDG
jgi:hypothetical protein